MCKVLAGRQKRRAHTHTHNDNRKTPYTTHQHTALFWHSWPGLQTIAPHCVLSCWKHWPPRQTWLAVQHVVPHGVLPGAQQLPLMHCWPGVQMLDVPHTMLPGGAHWPARLRVFLFVVVCVCVAQGGMGLGGRWNGRVLLGPPRSPPAARRQSLARIINVIVIAREAAHTQKNAPDKAVLATVAVARRRRAAQVAGRRAKLAVLAAVGAADVGRVGAAAAAGQHAARGAAYVFFCVCVCVRVLCL
jgi:hypothetical protein